MDKQPTTSGPSTEGALPPATGSALVRWHKLSELISDKHGLVELLAATCEDGIGVIARWTRNPARPSRWIVDVCDTEGLEWERVEEFDPDDYITPEPPTVFDDLPNMHIVSPAKNEIL